MKDSDPKELSAADLSAAARAAEYLRKRDKSIQYALLAIEKDATEEDAYPPLIRSLLNTDRPEEAAAILEASKSDLPSSSRIYSLHYIVYHKATTDKNYELAFAQIKIYFEWLSERLAHDASSVAQMRRHLKDFVQAHHAEGVQADLPKSRDLLVTKVRNAIQHVKEKNDDSRKTEDLNKLLKELELLEKELQNISEPDQVETNKLP